MRCLCHGLLAFLLLALASGGLSLPVQAFESTATVTLTATFSTHTSLRVSTSNLRFTLGPGERSATALVEYTAAARTRSGGEVLLTVEPDGAVQSGGGSGASAVVFCDGDGGRLALAEGTPRLARRWVGSGARQGAITFALEGASQSGSYSLPVRFVLSAP